MAYQIDPNLLKQVKRYGAFDVSACFHCGNCTAVCPLSKEDDTFPRRLIRYAQVGMEDNLLADKNLWLCYYCGECSETCPRQAEPGEFMAAARRYATAKADFTGLARLMYRSPALNVFMLLVLSALFTLLLLWEKGGVDHQQLELFKFIPGEFIHTLGIVLIAVVALTAVSGLVWTAWRFFAAKRQSGAKMSLSPRLLAASAVFAVRESLGQARYRLCDEDKQEYPWYRKPWFVHGAILWGFLGMLTATTLDFVLKEVAEWGRPVLDPMRWLGTLSGLLCLYGIAIVIGRRFKSTAKSYSGSRFSDWFFLLLLAFTVLTGFVVEVSVYSAPHLSSYVMFLAHVVLAMDLIVLMPLTKFAHAVYRPLALFFDEVARRSAAQPRDRNVSALQESIS